MENSDGKIERFRVVAGIATLPKRKHLLSALLAAALSASLVGWHLHHQTRPLTQEQRAILYGLVCEAAHHGGNSRQAVWSGLKRQLAVRRIDDLTSGQYQQATQILIPTATP